MAAGFNPLGALAARAIVARLAQGQGAEMAGAPQGPDDAAAMAMSRGLGEIRRSDPQALLRELSEIKRQVVALFPQLAFTQPGAAQGLAQTLRGLDNVIKTVQQAATTLNAAGGMMEPTGLPTGNGPQVAGGFGNGGGGFGGGGGGFF